ncbi:MAG: hypothetical protein Q9213_005387 [Squamulea squamosa]
MSLGFTSAEQSVLLDYLSPLKVRVLPKPLRSRHYGVALAIAGSLLTKFLIAISTGLFVSQDEVFLRHSLSPTKAFSLPDDFNSSMVDIRPQINLNGFNGTREYPVGSTEQYAFQPFHLPYNVSLARPDYSATVDIFTSDLDCQTSNQSYFKSGYGEASVPGCEISWSSEGQQVMNGQHILMQNGTCAVRGVESASEDLQRFVICAMDAKMQEYNDGMPHGDFGSAGAGLMATILADPITCLICSPTYSIKVGKVTMMDRAIPGISIPTSATTRQIPGLTTWQMGMSFFHSLGVIDTRNYLGETVGDQELVWGNDVFESLRLDTNPAARDFMTLYDAATLFAASRKTFQRLSAQVALLNLMSSTNTTNVRVDYQTSEPRFCVASAIFYIMELFLCVLALFSLLIAVFLRKHGYGPNNPSTLQGVSATIDASPRLASILHGIGHSSLKDLSTRIVRAKFRLTGTRGRVKETNGIEMYSGHASQTPLSNHGPPATRVESISWIPFVMKPLGCVLLFLLPAALLTTIVALLARSDKFQGITDLPSDTTRVHYGWTLLPVSIFLGMLAFYGTLDTAIRTLQPFHNLRQGQTNQDSHTYTKDFGGMIPIQAFVYALQHGNLAMLAATLTTLCAPIFPIAINGLFSPGTATNDYHGVNTKLTGWFNITDQPLPSLSGWPGLNNSDSFMATRIMYSNASYPQWTHSELALAEIDLVNDVERDAILHNSTTVLSHPPSITVEVPALRATMNCTSRPYNTARQKPYRSLMVAPDFTLLEVNLTLPDICNQLSDRDLSPFTCSNDMMSTQWMYKPGIIGYWARSWAQLRTTMGIFGDIDAKGNPNNLTMLTCMPYVETVQVKARFDLPSFEPADSRVAEGESDTSPIEVIESTREFFNHDSFWTLFGDRKIGGTFDEALPSVNLTGHPSPLASSDGFFQALFQGRDAVTNPQSLLGSANSDKLIGAVEHLYRVIMAQGLHTAQGRRMPVSSVSDSSQPSLGLGTISNPNGKRLYQSHIATYILVSLLAMMLVCTVVVLMTFRPKGLVSMEPTSIAARMSLLIEHHATAGPRRP